MPTSRRHEIDTSHQLGSFHNATAFSNAVMDDSYDLQAQSRGRDHRLLSQMNNALHTDSPLTSPLLSSRSSNPRNISQLQHKTHRSTRLDTSGTDPLKTSKTSDSLKPSKMADSFKPASLKLAKLSEFLKSKPPSSLQLTKKSDLLKKNKPSESFQLPKPTESKKKPKPSESLQLAKMPDPTQTVMMSGVERMSPVVEHARSLVNRHKTFGIDSKLDNIATSAITSPRDLKTDFFSVSPLTNYVKTRWPEKELELDLPSSQPLEELRTPKKDLYKNPYLESDGEDYEMNVVVKPKSSKPGELLKALRKKRSSEYTTDEGTDIDDEDYPKGAYAITKYEDDEETEKPRLSKKYEVEESSNEIALSHLVSAAALRARSVLENLTGLLGKGGLVNVEGDIKPYGGPLTTFRLHTPFHFQGPLMIGEKPALSVGDDSFERYIFGLQEKRKQERDHVEKDTRRLTKMSRSLANEPPKQYSLKPIGYISDKNYDSFSKSLVPFTTKFDKTIISPSSKKVHFDEDDEPKPTLSLSRELVPFAPKGIEDEMAVVPKRRRYPVYEYTEDIPLKLAFQFPSSDDDKERLSVLEKIRIKALLVGEDKLDDPDRPRPRKPRTRYYADKLQNLEDKEQLSSIMATPPTSTLKASKPPNYRLESRLEPEDLIHKPSTYGKMRDQVRGVQDKLDRHRQLLDRHANRVTTDSGLGDSHAASGNLSVGRTTEEGGAGDGTGKVSPLRKKLRKVICKSRHDPTYYDD